MAEIKVGELFFDHDPTRNEFYVGIGETIGSMCEHVPSEAYEVFYRLISTQKRVISVLSSLVQGDTLSDSDWKLVDEVTAFLEDEEEDW